jgi:hypothetical protein
LIEDSGKTSNVTLKNKGKQKVVDLDYVKVKTKKPKQANWENSKVLALKCEFKERSQKPC